MSRSRSFVFLAFALVAISATTLTRVTNVEAKEPLEPIHWLVAAPPPMQQAAPSVHASNPTEQLPSGDGRDVTTRVCGGCHGVNLFSQRRYTDDRWDSVIQNMISKGMNASDDDLTAVTKYLTTYMAPTTTKAPAADSSVTPPTPQQR